MVEINNGLYSSLRIRVSRLEKSTSIVLSMVRELDKMLYEIEKNPNIKDIIELDKMIEEDL